MFCDTHCHLDFEDYDADRAEVLARAKAAGLHFLVNPGVDLASSQAALQLAQEQPGFIFAAGGIHPNYVSSMAAGDLTHLAELAEEQQLVAIGEIGLDYYREFSDPKQQRQVFEAQLELAGRFALPVIIHNREASQDLLPILRTWQQGLAADSRLQRYPGVLHAYSGSLEEALEMAELGFFFGIGGPVTFQNAAERRSVVAGLPLDKILLETDAPFLTPHPHRGQRNEPAYIPLIAAQIATLHARTAEEIGQVTTQNAIALFNLGERLSTTN